MKKIVDAVERRRFWPNTRDRFMPKPWLPLHLLIAAETAADRPLATNTH